MKTAEEILNTYESFNFVSDELNETHYYHDNVILAMEEYAEIKVKEALSQQPTIAVAWPSSDELLKFAKRNCQHCAPDGFSRTCTCNNTAFIINKFIKSQSTAIDMEEFLKWIEKNTVTWDVDGGKYIFIDNSNEDGYIEITFPELIAKYNEYLKQHE